MRVLSAVREPFRWADEDPP